MHCCGFPRSCTEYIHFGKADVFKTCFYQFWHFLSFSGSVYFNSSLRKNIVTCLQNDRFTCIKFESWYVSKTCLRFVLGFQRIFYIIFSKEEGSVCKQCVFYFNIAIPLISGLFVMLCVKRHMIKGYGDRNAWLNFFI